MTKHRSTKMRFLLAMAVGVAGLVGYSFWKDPERSALSAAARAEVPGNFVTLSHGITHYEVAGPDTGRVVVMVHGFSVPAYIWDSTFNALSAAGYRTIRYDVYGRGFSDRPDAAYDGAFFDAQLDELLNALNVTHPVDLIGLSFGGFITGHYTAGHAARVRTLTLIDPASTSRSIPSFLRWPVIGQWFWQTTQVPTMAENQATDFLHPARYPTWADQYRPQMQYRGFGRALRRSLITMSNTNFAALYARVAQTQIPVLLIWGKQDQTIPLAMSEVIRTNIPAVDFFPVDSAGHLPHIEQAALVNSKLLQFFSAH